VPQASASPPLAELEADVVAKSAFVAPLLAAAGTIVLGQPQLLQGMLIALLCRGHVLIEGVPGVAKTLAVTTFARLLGLQSKRIQFTPDLLPSDLVGTPVFDPRSASFDIRRGPVFTHLLLADEINRAPAKVQSALLEAMEERQVTLGEQSLRLPDPFMVLATQNPLEHEGTYPLPEAQLDRFFLKLQVGYPDRSSEEAILDSLGAPPEPAAQPLATPGQLEAAMQAVRGLYLDAKVRGYLLDLVAATRDPAAHGLQELAPLIDHGVSPRGSLALALAAKALAFLRGRPYVTPDDVIGVVPQVLRHRLRLSYLAEADEIDADQLIGRILATVPRP